VKKLSLHCFGFDMIDSDVKLHLKVKIQTSSHPIRDPDSFVFSFDEPEYFKYLCHKVEMEAAECLV